MALNVEINLVQFKEIQSLLNQGVTKPIAESLKIIANNIRNTTKKNLAEKVYSVPRWHERTGKLQQSVTADKINNLSWKVQVGAEYGKFVEFGTSTPIRPKFAKFLVFTIRGTTYFCKSVRGQQANPFFNPAVKTVKADSLNIIREQIKKFTK